MKLCKDCHHFSSANSNDVWDKCNRPISENLVLGGKKGLWKDAEDERKTGECGPEAKFFNSRSFISSILPSFIRHG